ncbi:unnamed protein product [Phaedon cochleariae]|uniref:[acyl-carrier-protein] S-malonyltransferase n=1 Tax=Phaedon cochleariae TaxID=80249 RepID=A0A9P0GMC4_PHACE|nr:unnamed protein product [Phaedon cochleariae]
MNFPRSLLKLSSEIMLKKYRIYKHCQSIRQLSLSNAILCKSQSDDSKETLQDSPLKKLLEDSASFQDITNKEQQWVTLPYPEGTNVRKQGEFEKKNKKDPRDTSIILFPGQGSQYVGMAKNLLKFPMVKDLFELANYILRYDLLKLCLHGPKEQLDSTKYAQSAIMVCSLAAIEQLKEERPNAIANCVGTAGFSLGEITALVFAGALGFERALQLVRIRGEAMQLASEAYKGGMLTVLYQPDSKVNYACLKAKEWAVDKGDPLPECKVATYVYPHCKVIAGSESALEFFEKNYQQFNIRKIIRLPVSGPFHTELMRPAMETFRKALHKSEILDPVISVYSNVDGKKYRNAEHIRRQLPKHMIKPVKWEQLMHTVFERDSDSHYPRVFEVGPGTSLRAILKQVNAKAWSECYSIPA